MAYPAFTGLATNRDPGEIIHVYGVGFGPVTTPPLTEEPASANPLSVPLSPEQPESVTALEDFL